MNWSSIARPSLSVVLAIPSLLAKALRERRGAGRLSGDGLGRNIKSMPISPCMRIDAYRRDSTNSPVVECRSQSDMENEMTQEFELLDLNDLAAALKRRPETIKKDLRKNPLAVPPRVGIPGTRLLRWRRRDVETWLAENVVPRKESAQ
jgi:predicted DNA-binding transcriptional regulator AlpA